MAAAAEASARQAGKTSFHAAAAAAEAVDQVKAERGGGNRQRKEPPLPDDEEMRALAAAAGDDRRALAKALHDRKLRQTSIAARMSEWYGEQISQQTVSRFLAGPSRDYEEVRRLRNEEGMTQQAIADVMGIPRQTVARHLDRMSRIDRPVAEARRRDGASQQQIADEQGVVQRTVANHLPGRPRGDAGTAWKKEHDDNAFDLFRAIPPAPAQQQQQKQQGSARQEWMANASWTFCPLCGLRRPEGKFLAHKRLPASDVKKKCPNGCDLRPDELDQAQANRPAKKGPKLKAYVTPQASNWPREMKELSRADAMALSVIHLDAEYKSVRGGRAPVTNLKKTQLVRGRWRTEDVESRLSTQPQKNAFDWLMKHNTTYNWYVTEHRRLLRWRAEDQPGLFIITRPSTQR